MTAPAAIGSTPTAARVVDLALGDVSLRACSDCRAPLAALESALFPHCKRVVSPSDPVAWVTLWRSPPSAVEHRIDATRRRGYAARIDVFRGRASATRFASGTRVVVELHGTGTIAAFERGRRSVTIVQREEQTLCEDGVAIVRGQILTPSCAARTTVLHAAAAALNDRAVVVFGESGDGKTSTVAALLFARGAAFLSNDRVLLTMARGRPIASGLPYPLALGVGTANRHAGFRDVSPPLRRDPLTGKVTATSAALVSLGVPVTASARVDLLLRPRLDRCPGRLGADCMSVDETRAELERNLRHCRRDLAARNWARFVPVTPAPGFDEAAVLDALARTPCYRIFFSRGEDPRRLAHLVADLLARQRATSAVA